MDATTLEGISLYYLALKGVKTVPLDYFKIFPCKVYLI